MRVREIELTGFMSYVRHQRVVLPPTGLVLITGQNGAGKSGLLEAVSYAGWGKTLRGTDPRRAGEPGSVCLDTTFSMQVTRSWTAAGKKRLDVAAEGYQEFDFENPTKAQDHVIGVLGEWDTWRRACVFSMVDDMSFASATDADRKRLLECLLGLRRLDVALERCRADVKAAEQRRLVADTALGKARVRLESAQAHLVTLRSLAAAQAPQTDIAGLKDQIVALETQLTFQEAAAAEEWDKLEKLRKVMSEWELTDRQMITIGKALTSDPTCPTCGQDMPDNAELRARLDAHKAKHRAHRDAKPANISSADWQTATDAAHRTRCELNPLRADLAVAENALTRYQAAQDAVHKAQGDVLDLELALDDVGAELAAAQRWLAHLTTTDLVLGTKGVRAHLLTDALTGLETAANAWLERVARTDAPLTLKLAPYTEKKSGGTADAISLEVEGAGGGRGYKATSGGERRRIDVAIMLALAEVAQAADNRVAPTMWFDEVLDTLDAPGVLAVSDALDSLAADRCVVVISHNEDIIRNLVPTLRLHVNAGTIEVK
jgi:DNA repair exonuclease SbcCD ATPase subunit